MKKEIIYSAAANSPMYHLDNEDGVAIYDFFNIDFSNISSYKKVWTISNNKEILPMMLGKVGCELLIYRLTLDGSAKRYIGTHNVVIYTTYLEAYNTLCASEKAKVTKQDAAGEKKATSNISNSVMLQYNNKSVSIKRDNDKFYINNKEVSEADYTNAMEIVNEDANLWLKINSILDIINEYDLPINSNSSRKHTDNTYYDLFNTLLNLYF